MPESEVMLQSFELTASRRSLVLLLQLALLLELPRPLAFAFDGMIMRLEYSRSLLKIVEPYYKTRTHNSNCHNFILFL